MTMKDTKLPAGLVDTPDELLRWTEGALKQLGHEIEQTEDNSAERAILRAAHENLEKDYAAYVEAKIALAHELERAHDALSETR